MLRDIAARAADLGVGAVASKEGIAALAFEGALRCYLSQDQFTRDGVHFQVHAGPTIIVKATHGEADTQGIALVDVERAKLVVFARVLPGVEAQGIKNLVELRGFISRNEIRKHYRVTKYKTVPGYRVGVKRFKPITDLLWWLQDGGYRNGQDDLHATLPGGAAETGLPGGGGGTVDAVHGEG